MASITPSHIIQYTYCPRFTYFEYVLMIPQYEERDYKVMRGRHMHDEKLERNKEYLRKRIGVTEKYLDVYLTADNLRGRIDEVLMLEDRSMAPLDYKFAEYNDYLFRTHRLQLVCYSILIELNYGVQVNKGFLVYIRSNNRIVEVPVRDEEQAKVEEAISSIARIIDENYYPRGTKSKQQCLTCTYRNICVQ